MNEQQLYQHTRGWPSWWRRRRFGDAVVDAEEAAEAQEVRARILKGANARLDEENRDLRDELANLRRRVKEG